MKSRLTITLMALITMVIVMQYGWIAALGFWAGVITVTAMAVMVLVAWIARIDVRGDVTEQRLNKGTKS